MAVFNTTFGCSQVLRRLRQPKDKKDKKDGTRPFARLAAKLTHSNPLAVAEEIVQRVRAKCNAARNRRRPARGGGGFRTPAVGAAAAAPTHIRTPCLASVLRLLRSARKRAAPFPCPALVPAAGLTKQQLRGASKEAVPAAASPWPFQAWLAAVLAQYRPPYFARIER